jgi:hypothetical protein
VSGAHASDAGHDPFGIAPTHLRRAPRLPIPLAVRAATTASLVSTGGAALRSRRLFAVPVVALLLLVGCSSGSGSSSGSPTPTPSPTATRGTAVVDRAGVDSVLGDVLSGLRAATSVPRGATVAGAAAAIQRAADDFAAAGQALIPIPAGVPAGAAAPVSQRVLQLSGLFHDAAACLERQSRAQAPDTRRCLPPLRRANAKDNKLAHELISLAVYGSRSPKTFESKLVHALK